MRHRFAVKNVHSNTQGQSTKCGGQNPHFCKQIIVANIVAINSRSSDSLIPNTSARTTVNVLPGFRTFATAAKRSPFAGRSRFTLNSTLNTSEPAGINVYAAYPQAVS